MRTRDGTECKKQDCIHYKERRVLSSGAIKYCMACKWAYRSQYNNLSKRSKG